LRGLPQTTQLSFGFLVFDFMFLNFGVKVSEISFVPSVHEFHKPLKIIAVLNNEWLKLHVARSCSRYAVLVCSTAQFNGEVKVLLEFLFGDFHTDQHDRVFINVQKKERFLRLSFSLLP
jgi:hypothetical protein